MLQRFHKEMLVKCPKAYEAVSVDISEVADWFMDAHEEKGMPTAADFPTVTPPWPLAWFEYQVPTPTKTYSGVSVDRIYFSFLGDSKGITTTTRVGILLDGTEIADKSSDIYHNPDTTAWLLTASLFTIQSNRIYEYGQVIWPINSVGKLLKGWSETNITWPTRLEKAIMDDPFNTRESFYRIWTQVFMDIAFFAISLLHCKNISLEEIEIPPKVQKAREKKGIPAVTYKTLIVEPMRKQVRRERDADPEGEQNTVKRALHIVRGHFMDYTQGAGLFRKMHGIYWQPMHVKGSAEAGKVIKDYKVRQPATKDGKCP